MKVTSDDRRILSGGADGRVIAWEPHAGTQDQVVHFSRHYTTIKSLHDGRFMIGGQNRLILCDRAGAVLQKIGPWAHWHIAAALPAGLVFGASLTNEVRAWNVSTGKQVLFWLPQDQRENIAIAATPDGSTVCLIARLADGSRQLQIIDVGSGSLAAQLPVQSANDLDISPDGRWLAFNSKMTFSSTTSKIAPSLALGKDIKAQSVVCNSATTDAAWAASRQTGR